MINTTKYISILILLFTLNVSFGQDLKPLPEIEVGEFKGNSASISMNEAITIQTDSNFYYHFVVFKKNENIMLIDTVEITPYGFNFRLFKMADANDRLLIAEVEYEHVSEYPVYFITETGFEKVGNLNISLDCDTCDALNYPLSEIVLKGNENGIEFSFNKDLVLRYEDESRRYGKDEVKFLFDIDKNEFKIE